jgi:hypothetical protein
MQVDSFWQRRTQTISVLLSCAFLLYLGGIPPTHEKNQTRNSLCCESLRKVVFEPRVGAAWLHMMGHTGPDKLLIAKARNRLWRRGLQRIRAHTPTRNAKVCNKTRGGEAPSPHHQTPKPDCSEDPWDARGLWGIVAPM